MNALLSEPEAAARLHLSVRKVQQLRAERRIAWVRLGRRAWFTEADLDAYLESQKQRVEVVTLRRRSTR